MESKQKVLVQIDRAIGRAAGRRARLASPVAGRCTDWTPLLDSGTLTRRRGKPMSSELTSIRERILAACPAASLIVLFGSRARGDARPDSDVDLLVVAPAEVSSTQWAATLRLALWDLDSAVDVVVVSPEAFQTLKGFKSSVVHEAMAEGVVLHEAA